MYQPGIQSEKRLSRIPGIKGLTQDLGAGTTLEEQQIHHQDLIQKV